LLSYARRCSALLEFDLDAPLINRDQRLDFATFAVSEAQIEAIAVCTFSYSAIGECRSVANGWGIAGA
jgi:hypothetical protein